MCFNRLIPQKNMKKLNEIQQNLKAPKGQTNSFGKYKYRSCEDILEAVKPLLGEATLIISDEIVMLGDRFYVKATATLKDGKEEISNTAYARESHDKKGMDESQITGATSSYARKYALNGLFLIDDTKDADTMDNRSQVKNEAHSASQSLEIAGFCNVCGEQAIKSPKSGRYFCPNWKDHKEKGENYKIVQTSNATTEQLAFQVELDNL